MEVLGEGVRMREQCVRLEKKDWGGLIVGEGRGREREGVKEAICKRREGEGGVHCVVTA